MHNVFFAILIFAVGLFVGMFIIEQIVDTSVSPAIATPEPVIIKDYKLTIHTAKGAMSYLPAPKTENVGNDLMLWFYPDDADIYAISVTESEG